MTIPPIPTTTTTVPNVHSTLSTPVGMEKAMASIVMGLRSPYLVNYIDIFTDDDKYPGWTFFVTEYCEKGDLSKSVDDLIRMGATMLLETILKRFGQIAVGLFILHTHHIVHRDIKPANIFVDENDVAKIGDFGISKSLKDDLQKTIAVAGTIQYMAPEIFTSFKGYDISCDIYSFGALMYVFVTRTNYSHGAANNSSSSAFSITDPGVPDDVKDLIRSMLAVDPAARPKIGDIVLHPRVRATIESFPRHTLPASLLQLYAKKERKTEKQHPPIVGE